MIESPTALLVIASKKTDATVNDRPLSESSSTRPASDPLPPLAKPSLLACHHIHSWPNMRHVIRGRGETLFGKSSSGLRRIWPRRLVGVYPRAEKPSGWVCRGQRWACLGMSRVECMAVARIQQEIGQAARVEKYLLTNHEGASLVEWSHR